MHQASGLVTLQPIIDPNSPEYRRFSQIYRASFPPDQRRPEGAQKACLSNELFRLLAIIRDAEMVGCLSYWDLDGAVYVEHLAIERSLRGTGAGSAALAAFLRVPDKLIVLESDPPSTADPASVRRLSFYDKLGFVENSYPYIQSPFAAGQSAVPAMLLSYPRALTDNAEFGVTAQSITAIAHAC